MSTRSEQALVASVAMLFNTADPVARLRAIRGVGDQIRAWQRALVTEARRRGLSWAEIGAALGTSEQAAWEAYNGDLRRRLDETRARASLGDEEAFALVDEEREAIYQARRR